MPAFGLFAAVVAGNIQPLPQTEVAVSPRQPAERTGSALPFETGWIGFTFRIGRDGGTGCTAVGGGAAFVQLADHYCRDLSFPEPSPEGESETDLSVTTHIGIVREGETSSYSSVGPGQRVYDGEAEVEVAPDGTIRTCRMVGEENVTERPFGVEGMCADVMRGPAAFVAVPPGAGVRRGRLRIVSFVERRPRDHGNRE